MIRFLTAGESHGEAEIGILEGLPAGMSLSVKDIQPDLERRRGGLGRGGRGKIETDDVRILSGIRFGKTIGSPVAIFIKNLDYENWKDKFPSKITNPRPGHADLAGMLKYHLDDARNVLERASARETVMRVAIGAICRKFLSYFSVKINSKIIQIGNIRTSAPLNLEEMEELILTARKIKDTLGGIIEICAENVPPGLGSYIQWDKRLDGKITQILMSIPSVKAVELGEGIKNAELFGSQVHDLIYFDKVKQKYFRKTNRAGGIEGGISNGENIICRIFFKPISTLGNPLTTVDIKTKRNAKAVIERSDICVIPRAGVIGETSLCFVLAKAFMEKFGGDSILETKRNFEGFMNEIATL